MKKVDFLTKQGYINFDFFLQSKDILPYIDYERLEKALKLCRLFYELKKAQVSFKINSLEETEEELSSLFFVLRDESLSYVLDILKSKKTEIELSPFHAIKHLILLSPFRDIPERSLSSILKYSDGLFKDVETEISFLIPELEKIKKLPRVVLNYFFEAYKRTRNQALKEEILKAIPELKKKILKQRKRTL